MLKPGPWSPPLASVATTGVYSYAAATVRAFAYAYANARTRGVWPPARFVPPRFVVETTHVLGVRGFDVRGLGAGVYTVHRFVQESGYIDGDAPFRNDPCCTY